MWPFSKKPKKAEPIVTTHKIPFEHRARVCELWDELRNSTKKTNQLGALKMWRAIGEAVKNEGLPNGDWTLEFENHCPVLKITHKQKE